MNSLQIMDKKATLKKRGLEIIETAKKEVRDLTDAETVEIQEIKDQMSQLDEEMKALNERLQNLRFDDDEEDAEKETPSEEDTEDEEEDNKEEKSINRNMKKEKFSLVKAIRAIVNNQPFDDCSLAVIKAGETESRKAGISAQGQIQIPMQRSTVSVSSDGEDIVVTDIMNILTPLRAKSVLAQAGAKIMSGLVGDVQFPIMSPSNVFFGAELSEAQDGAPSFTNVKLSPCRLTCYVDISRQLLNQTSEDLEAVIRQDIINAINSKLEATILGEGDGKEGGDVVVAPVGILNTLTPTEVSTFADICDVEANVEDANVMGECKYIMSNKTKAALRAMKKDSEGNGLVYSEGTVDGTPAYNTSNVPATDGAKNFIYGDWSNLVIGFWGGMEILTDVYTKSTAGQVRLVCNVFVDSKLLRPNAFAAGTVVSE